MAWGRTSGVTRAPNGRALVLLTYVRPLRHCWYSPPWPHQSRASAPLEKCLREAGAILVRGEEGEGPAPIHGLCGVGLLLLTKGHSCGPPLVLWFLLRHYRSHGEDGSAFTELRGCAHAVRRVCAHGGGVLHARWGCMPTLALPTIALLRRKASGGTNATDLTYHYT
eukprot:828131-Prorocentrum_minimum.AAC.1